MKITVGFVLLTSIALCSDCPGCIMGHSHVEDVQIIFDAVRQIEPSGTEVVHRIVRHRRDIVHGVRKFEEVSSKPNWEPEGKVKEKLDPENWYVPREDKPEGMMTVKDGKVVDDYSHSSITEKNHAILQPEQEKLKPDHGYNGIKDKDGDSWENKTAKPSPTYGQIGPTSNADLEDGHIQLTSDVDLEHGDEKVTSSHKNEEKYDVDNNTKNQNEAPVIDKNKHDFHQGNKTETLGHHQADDIDLDKHVDEHGKMMTSYTDDIVHGKQDFGKDGYSSSTAVDKDGASWSKGTYKDLPHREDPINESKDDSSARPAPSAHAVEEKHDAKWKPSYQSITHSHTGSITENRYMSDWEHKKGKILPDHLEAIFKGKYDVSWSPGYGKIIPLYQDFNVWNGKQKNEMPIDAAVEVGDNDHVHSEPKFGDEFLDYIDRLIDGEKAVGRDFANRKVPGKVDAIVENYDSGWRPVYRKIEHGFTENITDGKDNVNWRTGNETAKLDHSDNVVIGKNDVSWRPTWWKVCEPELDWTPIQENEVSDHTIDVVGKHVVSLEDIPRDVVPGYANGIFADNSDFGWNPADTKVVPAYNDVVIDKPDGNWSSTDSVDSEERLAPEYTYGVDSQSDGSTVGDDYVEGAHEVEKVAPSLDTTAKLIRDNGDLDWDYRGREIDFDQYFEPIGDQHGVSWQHDDVETVSGHTDGVKLVDHGFRWGPYASYLPVYYSYKKMPLELPKKSVTKRLSLVVDGAQCYVQCFV